MTVTEIKQAYFKENPLLGIKENDQPEKAITKFLNSKQGKTIRTKLERLLHGSDFIQSRGEILKQLDMVIKAGTQDLSQARSYVARNQHNGYPNCDERPSYMIPELESRNRHQTQEHLNRHRDVIKQLKEPMKVLRNIQSFFNDTISASQAA